MKKRFDLETILAKDTKFINDEPMDLSVKKCIKREIRGEEEEEEPTEEEEEEEIEVGRDDIPSSITQSNYEDTKPIPLDLSAWQFLI